MTDDDKAALVEELAEALHDVNLARIPELFDTWEVEQTGEARHPDMGYVTLTREQATACLPIIDRLLAERDVDAMLDSVGAEIIEGPYTHYGNYHVGIEVAESGDAYEGTGPTRMAALRNAVAQAKEQGNE